MYVPWLLGLLSFLCWPCQTQITFWMETYLWEYNMIYELLSFEKPPRLVEECGRPVDVLVMNFASNMTEIDCHPAPVFIDLSDETCDRKWRWEQIYPRSKARLPLLPPSLPSSLLASSFAFSPAALPQPCDRFLMLLLR